MKIIAYLNSNCRRSRDFRAIMDKYNLNYEEHTADKLSELSIKATQNPGEKPSLCVEIDGTKLSDISGEAVENYLREKGLIESVDKKTAEISTADEEKEAILTKTVRFF